MLSPRSFNISVQHSIPHNITAPLLPIPASPIFKISTNQCTDVGCMHAVTPNATPYPLYTAPHIARLSGGDQRGGVVRRSWLVVCCRSSLRAVKVAETLVKHIYVTYFIGRAYIFRVVTWRRLLVEAGKKETTHPFGTSDIDTRRKLPQVHQWRHIINFLFILFPTTKTIPCPCHCPTPSSASKSDARPSRDKIRLYTRERRLLGCHGLVRPEVADA